MSSPLTLLSEDAKIVKILDGLQTAAGTDRTSELIDTAGFDGCLILLINLTVHNSAVQAAFLQSSDVATNETTLSSGADVLNSNIVIAGTDDNKVIGWDFQPGNRYYQVAVNKDGTNAGDELAIVILYHSESRPVTHGAGGTTVGEGTVAVGTIKKLGLAVQGLSGA